MYCASSSGCTGSPRDAPRWGYGVSAKEAGIAVLPDQSEELLDRGNIRRGLVTVPLHVLTHPEDPPPAHGAHVASLGDGNLNFLPRSATEGVAHLKDLDTLTREPEREVNLLAEVV